MSIKRKLLFFPALAAGVVILVLAVNLRPKPPTKPAESRARLVQVMEMAPAEIAPVAEGFGKVAPKLEWKAIAEVSGKVIYRNPLLEKGRLLPAGTEILRIDPLDYELKLAQAEADLSSSQTQLAKLEQELKNLKGTLSIERNRLAIAKKELERKQNLRKKGLTSQSDVDQQTQSYLSQQKMVADMQNQLSLFPDERKVAQAQIKVNHSRVKEARRSLEKTSVVLPEEMRIAEVDIEQDQVVNVQQTMVIGHGVETMEVEAQIAIHDMRVLASGLSQHFSSEFSATGPDLSGFNASIELSSGRSSVSWPARVARISETVDPNQATVGVILEVDQDYQNLNPGKTPPLVNGMFVRARIEGQGTQHWVIPERALHGDIVYLVDAEQRLKKLPVKVLFRRDNQVAIEGGLVAGDKLILNDLLPAIEGMQVREEDKESAL